MEICIVTVAPSLLYCKTFRSENICLILFSTDRQGVMQKLRLSRWIQISREELAKFLPTTRSGNTEILWHSISKEHLILTRCFRQIGKRHITFRKNKIKHFSRKWLAIIRRNYKNAKVGTFYKCTSGLRSKSLQDKIYLVLHSCN